MAFLLPTLRAAEGDLVEVPCVFAIEKLVAGADANSGRIHSTVGLLVTTEVFDVGRPRILIKTIPKSRVIRIRLLQLLQRLNLLNRATRASLVLLVIRQMY